ncbi:MAG: hypothetical protein NDI77_07690 [Geobacteraceae bacterium]|nr:hypothetical protein [Geobacteraceae bacterium]
MPGIDDGPATMEEAVAMAAALREAGFTEVCCTPHLIKGYYDADNDTVRKIVAALQARLNDERIELELLPGREYYLDEFLLDYLKDPLPLGHTRHILVEVPNHVSAAHVKEACYRIKCSGYTPMIAHPERCLLFAVAEKQTAGWFKVLGSLFKVGSSQQDVERRTSNVERSNNPLLDYLRDIGCKFQGNLGSFAGLYGGRVKGTAEKLKELGIYSHFGSDLHSAASMGQILAGADAAGISGAILEA